MTPFEWTPEHIAELEKFWDEGLTTSEIGRRLGITKNSVVGKARRLDLTMRRQPTRKPVETKTISMERLNPNMCSWPTGEPGSPDFTFCGSAAVPGKPYCADHCAMAYVKGTKDRKPPRAA